MAIPVATNGNASVFPGPPTEIVLPVLLLVTPYGTILPRFTSWPLIVKSWLNSKSSEKMSKEVVPTKKNRFAALLKQAISWPLEKVSGSFQLRLGAGLK